ncbi:MAG TPA: MgtC/SapB family protein [Chitinophagaceae bacterium]|nr:MgtC/SapB family protein [Chitinophagaceae bacterium]
MIEWTEILLRLGLASLFGALIGLERERKNWSAGLRTHMMVAVGSCLIMLVSMFGFSDVLKMENIGLDPSRIAAQVVSGIGFIGAGTILFIKKNTIRGLTTASGLWTVAAIGLATGSGMYFAAGATTVIALIILVVLQRIEHITSKNFREMTMKIVIDAEDEGQVFLKDILSKEHLKVKTFTIEKKQNDFILEVIFDQINVKNMDEIVLELNNVPAVKEIYWTKA